jgi:hypothetical protein
LLDVVPRIIAEKLSAKWDVPVIIENRPGVGLPGARVDAAGQVPVRRQLKRKRLAAVKMDWSSCFESTRL